MSETRTIELVTWNKKLIQMHGEKLTKTQWLIGLRSNGLHQELRFSDFYGNISGSATMADGTNCYRLSNIAYSHPYRQTRVRMEVTPEQETILFVEACKMADLEYDKTVKICQDLKPKQILHGPDAIPYDFKGAAFGFISKREIWKMHPEKVICNESCGMILKKVWPGILITDKAYNGTMFDYPIAAFLERQPHELTPDQTEYLVRHYTTTVLSNRKA